MKSTPKTEAKYAILSDLLAFPTLHKTNWEQIPSSTARIGDLVSLNCAPACKWYVSWVENIKIENRIRYWLLKSIEDDSTSWWTNIGLNIYSRERVAERPAWKWTDAQFAFNDRWMKAFNRSNSIKTAATFPKFMDDGSVILILRERYSNDLIPNPKTFPNWKKLTIKEMTKYVQAASENKPKKP